MSELWLLRHAKAVPQNGEEDRNRALAPKGETAMQEIGAWAARLGLAPGLILCSSATRTRQTLALLLPQVAGRPEVKFEDALYLAEAERILARLRRVPAKYRSVLVVGHNPGLHELAVLLMQPGAGLAQRRLAANLPTGALAGFTFDAPWSALAPKSARLDHYVTPKELRD